MTIPGTPDTEHDESLEWIFDMPSIQKLPICVHVRLIALHSEWKREDGHAHEAFALIQEVLAGVALTNLTQ